MEAKVLKVNDGEGQVLLTYKRLAADKGNKRLEEAFELCIRDRNQVVELDEERKAAMVSNLLVVLCGNHDAQPVVNSGSLY